MTTTPSPDQRARFEAQCTLEDCPTGLFVFKGTLCFKSEYGDNNGNIHAYVVSSGEAFWGGTSSIAVKRLLLVTPITNEHADSLLTQPTPPREVAQGLREAVKQAVCASATFPLWEDRVNTVLAALAPYVTAQASAETLGGDRHGGRKVPNELPVISSEPTSRATPAPTSGKVEGTPISDAAHLQLGKVFAKHGVNSDNLLRDVVAAISQFPQLETDLKAARKEVERLKEARAYDYDQLAFVVTGITEPTKEDMEKSPILGAIATLRATSEELAGALEKSRNEHRDQARLWASVDDPENAAYHKKQADEEDAALARYRAATPAQPDQLKKETNL